MKQMYIGLIAAAVLFQAGSLLANEGAPHEATEQSASADAATAKKYVCPMHPDVQSDEPGQCPKCGMTLKSQASGAHDHSTHHH